MLLGISLVAPSVAQDASDDETRRLEEIEERLRENARQAETLRNRTARAQEALAALQARLVETAESLQSAEARATEVEETLALLEAQEMSASADLERHQADISNMLAALLSLERSRPPALAVSPDDANAAAIAAIALSSITPELKGQADGYRADLARIERLRRRMDEERAELVEAETALSERRRLLQNLLDERAAAQQRDAARLRQLEREDAQLAREATNLRELIAGITRRPDAGGVPDPMQGVETTALYDSLPSRFIEARSLLPMPAAGRVVSGFGERLSGGGRSDDIAIATRARAVVTAPFGGRVEWAEPFGRLGNVVIIDVGDQHHVVLVGLGTLEVRSGDRIRAGEPLGTMTDGRETRLRMQIRHRNVPIDPGPWLRTSLAEAAP
jgi:septal ring factor EnvC (AmiA/AmiB activator)